MTTPPLPTDHETEFALLNALISDPESYWRADGLVSPSDFSEERHGIIFDAIQAGALEGSGPPDETRLASILSDTGQLERIGGRAYLADLLTPLPDVTSVAVFAERVHEMAMRRTIIRVAQRAMSEAATGTSAQDVCGSLLSSLTDLDAHTARDGGDLAVLAALNAADVRERRRSGVRSFGVMSGIEPLDQLLGGIRPGGLYLIAARPRIGKSAFADQIAANVSKTDGGPVFLLITEMSPKARAYRRLSNVTGIPVIRIFSGSLTQAEDDLLAQVERSERSTGPSVLVESASGLTAASVRLAVKRMAARHGKPKLVVVDYLQQLKDANPRASGNERTGEKVGQLRELALEVDAPVIACSQLSRESEKEKRAPRLSDLRESGELEQDAYAVVFLHRPNPENTQAVVALVEKHRDGPCGAVPMWFDGPTFTFSAVEERGAW